VQAEETSASSRPAGADDTRDARETGFQEAGPAKKPRV